MANNHCKKCNSLIEKYNLDVRMCDKCISERLKELENKACSECWEYCFENGLNKAEQEEYDDLVYGRLK